MKNSEIIENLIKENREINSQIFEQIKLNLKQKPLHLYEIGSIQKYLMRFARFQVLFYTIGGVIYFSTLGREKYQYYKDEYDKVKMAGDKPYREDQLKKKISILFGANIFFFVSCCFGLVFTSKQMRKTPLSIYYLDNNMFRLSFNTIQFKKSIIETNQLEIAQSNKKLNKSVGLFMNKNPLYVLGTGTYHRKLTEFIIQNQQQ